MLVIRRGGLGDTLLLAPVLAALRRHWRLRLATDVAVHLAGDSQFAAVLQAYGVCDEAFSSEALELFALQAPDGRGERARTRLRRYAAVVGDDEGLRAVAGPNVQVFDPRPQAFDRPLPLLLGEQLGLEVDLADCALRRETAAIGGPVALAPGSGGVPKCWPKERWLELARRLAARGDRLVAVVGPAEQERDDPRRWPWEVEIEFLHGLSCVDLARELGRAAAFVGNDSGTSHLAAMLGLPTVAVFGGGWPRVFAPIGPRVRVVESGGRVPPDAPVAAVQDALVALR